MKQVRDVPKTTNNENERWWVPTFPSTYMSREWQMSKPWYLEQRVKKDLKEGSRHNRSGVQDQIQVLIRSYYGTWVKFQQK